MVTRLYGPEAFGVLGVFLSASAILAPLSTAGYSLATALPSDDADAHELQTLSVLVALGVGLFLLPVVILFRDQLAGLLGAPSVAPYLWLLAPLTVVTGYELARSQWLVRKERFRAIGVVASSQALAVGAAKVGIGVVSPGVTSLVLVSVIGKVIHAILLWLAGLATQPTVGPLFAPERRTRRQAVARQYADYPRFRAPQDLLNASSRNLPTIIFAAFFGPAIAGFYSLGQRVLQLPISLVSKAVGKVLLPRLAHAARTGASLQRRVIQTTIALAAVGLIPFGLIAVFGPMLFGWVFGAEWAIAGTYARWLSIWLFLGFVNVPAVQSLPFSQSQRFLLVWEFFSSVGKLLLVVGLAALTSDVRITIISYALFGALAYVVLIAVAIHRAAQPERARALTT